MATRFPHNDADPYRVRSSAEDLRALLRNAMIRPAFASPRLRLVADGAALTSTSLPAEGGIVWIGPACASREAREAAHAHGLCRLLACPPEAVRLGQGEAGAPLMLAPVETGLWLSRAGRGDLAVYGVARRPLGIDVERVEPEGGIPWNVLAPAEREALIAHPEGDRALAFARLWSVKEAYLKALGTGLRREPADFSVGIGAEGLIAIEDATVPARLRDAAVTTLVAAGRTYALAAVLLN